jgi:hypothetical protein
MGGLTLLRKPLEDCLGIDPYGQDADATRFLVAQHTFRFPFGIAETPVELTVAPPAARKELL